MDEFVSWRRYSRYHVEINHPGTGVWNHIHAPDWEHALNLDIAAEYADRVRADHPGAEVRIVQTERIRGTRPDGTRALIDGAVEIVGSA